MNDLAGDSSVSNEGEWYFSRDGQQSGPLTYADLKEKADEGLLFPRLDLVWKEGMSDWRPIGEIEGLFERRPPPAEAAPATDDPFIAPETDPLSGLHPGGGEWPGARRRAYLIGIFIFPFLWNFVFAFALAHYKNFKDGAPLPEILVLGLTFVPVLVALYYSIQRFPNLGMSRFWFLANFVPFLNIWTGYRCFACPAGYAFHKKLDGIGIFLAIVYWLFIALSILIAVGLFLVLLRGAGDPELQQKLREALGPVIEKYQDRLQVPAK